MTEQQEKQVDFIVFSDDWGEHPSSCQHLFRHLAENHRVLWVNTIGMRNPRFCRRDLKKIALKVKKMFRGRGKGEKKRPDDLAITVCQPPMLPYSNFCLIRAINRVLVRRVVRQQLRKLGFQAPILVTTVPNSCDSIGHLGERLVVYYCVDDFSQWPGLEKELVRKMEKRLINRADRFIASSQKLYERLKRTGRPAYLLTHGVDLELYRQEPAAEHPLLADIPGPRIGYFGLFDDRSDQSFLLEAAIRLPHVSFVITGQVEADISALSRQVNIHFTGPVAYEALPAMVKGWDGCMLFYRVNDLTDAIQPLKLKEYLATGKPIFVTPIAEALPLNEYLTVVHDVEEFVDRYRFLSGATEPMVTPQLNDFLQRESWQRKSRVFLAKCCENLNL